MGDRELEQICRQIYNKHKKALDLIFEYKPDLYSDISNDLQEFIKNTPGLILDDSNKTYIRFTTELLDKHFGKMEVVGLHPIDCFCLSFRIETINLF